MIWNEMKSEMKPLNEMNSNSKWNEMKPVNEMKLVKSCKWNLKWNEIWNETWKSYKMKIEPAVTENSPSSKIERGVMEEHVNEENIPSSKMKMKKLKE